jgi:hypothetical protein
MKKPWHWVGRKQQVLHNCNAAVVPPGELMSNLLLESFFLKDLPKFKYNSNFANIYPINFSLQNGGIILLKPI